MTATTALQKLGFEAFERQAESNCPVRRNAAYLAENDPKKISCLWSNDYKALLNMCESFNLPVPIIIDRFHAAALLKSLMMKSKFDEDLILEI